MTYLEQLKAASAAVATAREAQLQTLKQLYPEGAYVRWKAGSYIQAGIVQQHSRYEDVLWAVNEHTKKRVKVTAYSIMQALEDN